MNQIKKKNTLFVWPEGVFSGYNFKEILKFKKISNLTLIKIILSYLELINYNEKKKYFNSLVLVNNKLEIIKEYKKQKLVPFGEFLPFEKF